MSRRERKAREAEARERQAKGIKPPRRGDKNPIEEEQSLEPARSQSPEVARVLGSPLRHEKKLARLRRRGELDEFKRELVDEVFKSCCDIANLNCNLDQPTPLGNDGALLVGKQLMAGCRCVRREAEGIHNHQN